MTRFTLHKRNNPCPICGSVKGNCKTSDKGLVLCHDFIDSDAGIPGWKWIKSDKSGVWGVFAPNDRLFDFDREEWSRRKAEQDTRRQRENQKQFAEALDIPSRNQAIRTLHKYLGLGSRHRQNLRDRGLSDAQIEAGHFFTIHSCQELPPGIPANLPGVAWGKLATKTDGFACPAWDVHGHLIGWQLRVDEAVDNKYRWSRGWKSSHLPNGELPITVCRPTDGVKRPGVGLAEGLLKPYIAAQRLGQIFIGAAGANFVGSPEQLKESIDALKPETVTLYPDAGSVCNPHVMGQYQRTIELVIGWGCAVNVAWWHQVDKQQADVDELIGTEAISYISPEEFLSLGAQHSGYMPPTHKHDCSGDRPISRDQWELTFGFGKRLRERVRRALKGFKGFGKPPQPEPKEAPDQLFQDANRRLQIWQDAAARGYRYILDSSAPGLGKSHAAGVALPDAFGTQKLWYLSGDHRNPTTGVIESNYVDLPVRHNGLKIDDTRHTPNGNRFKVHPKPGEEPNTRANCYRTRLFRAFAAKGYRHQESAKSSDICNNCKVAHLCKQGIGVKYGATFRGERASALSSDRIRAHADSLPSLDEFNYSTSGLLWDEAGTHLKAMDEISVSLEEFDRTWAELESIAPDLHEQFKPLRLALRQFLTGVLKQPYHGWDDAAIRALLPEKPNNLSEASASLDALLQPDLSFLEQKVEFLGATDAKRLNISQGMKTLINEEFRRQANEEFQEAFNRLPLNWLVPFLRIWNGEQGALRSERGTLTIFVGSDRHTAVVRSAKFNIFLDATIDRDQLALLLGIDPSEIYVVEQEMPNHGNLKIVQIVGMGKLGKDRSDSLKDRVAALRKGLEERYPGIVFGDWKCHAETGDGQWFVNLRGSNEFQNAPAMAVFGIPYQNIGYLQALYQTLTGEYAPLDKENPHEGLQQFVEAHTQAEIEQSLGRLRSHLRPDEELTFIFVGDYDLDFLGGEVDQIEAFQITPEAGTLAQITRWKILEAVRQLREEGEKVTQQAIASLAEISQPAIAKVATNFGGWKRLSKILLALLDRLYSDSNNFDLLTDEQRWLSETYLPTLLNELPEDAVQEIAAVIQVYGISTFLRILTAATPKTQARLLLLVMRSLPIALQSELLNLIEGAT